MVLSANAETGTDGTQLTVASGDFDLIANGTSGSTSYNAANAIKDTLSYKTIAGSGNTYDGWSTSLGGTQTELWLRMYAEVPTFYNGSLCQFRYSGASACRVSINTNGKILLINGAGTTLVTSTTALTAGAAFRIELHCLASASPTGGTLEVRIFTNMQDTTPVETLGPYATTQTATGIDQVWFGPTGASAGSVLYHDEDSVTTAGWLGPVGTPTSPPVHTQSPPKPSGDTTVGSTLTAYSPGTWTGNPTPTFTYQWRRCDTSGANSVDISGATAMTYVLTSADVGSTIRVAVTGTNTSGSSTAASTYTAVITAIPVTSINLANNCDGPNGTALTTANSGGDTGDGFNTINLTFGGTIAYDATYKAHGTASLKIIAGGSNTNVEWTGASLGTQTEIYGRAYVRLGAYPAGGAGLIRVLSGSTLSASINITNTGTLRLRDASNTVITNGASTVPINTWIRLEWHAILSTTAATLTLQYYSQADASLPTETLNAPANTVLTASADSVTYGLSNATSGDIIWIDDVAISDSWLGPISTLAVRWGWGMVATPGKFVAWNQGLRTAGNVIWGMNLFNGGSAYYGTSETAAQVIARLSASYTKIGMSKTYYNALNSSFDMSYEGQNPSKRVVVCFKYPQDDLAAGVYDGVIQSYVRSIPAGWYVILVNWQEPDNDMLGPNASFTPAQHVAASNHVATLVHQEIANHTLQSGVTCEVWDNFQYTTIRFGIHGSYWDDSYAALQTDGIAWDLYVNPPPGARENQNGGAATPITGSSYGVGTTNYDPAKWVDNCRTIALRNGFGKWGFFELGAPFRSGDIFATTGQIDGYNRADWFKKCFDALIAKGASVALVFNAIGAGFDQRLIVGDSTNFTGNYPLIPDANWNPSPRPTPNEEPAVAAIRSYFTNGL